jgi:TatD DNase family protein
VIADLPLESVVLETDSPDMAPAMFPGMRNSPEHLPAICAAIAGLMNIPTETLAAASTANACEVFGWG